MGIGLILLGLLVGGFGVFVYVDANKPTPAMPLLFSWAQGVNQKAGTAIGVVCGIIGAVLIIAGVVNLV